MKTNTTHVCQLFMTSFTAGTGRLVGFNCQPDATQKHFVVQQHGYVKCEHEISNYDEVVEVSVATSVESL